MMDYLRICYNILNSVYREGAYVNLALKEGLKSVKSTEKQIITRIVYGVVEKHQEFSFMIKKLCKVQPKSVIRLVLRLGMYLIKYMDSIPNYAAVDGVVELTKEIGKKQLAAFVNATLKGYVGVRDELPTGKDGLAIQSNMPIWLIDMYIEEYGYHAAVEIINKQVRHTHIRHNSRRITKENLAKMLDNKTEYKATDYGYLVGSTDQLGEILDSGYATVQALCSILVCEALTPNIGGKVLDACAAPGGKSVYLSEQNKSAVIYASDIYPHRTQLIEAYKTRMSADNIVVQLQDATHFETKYLKFFDAVLADVPCSGVGTIGSNPDILINRKKEDIEALCKLQSSILDNVSRYVKGGGVLVYSTCSNLKRENERIVEKFLESHSEFDLDTMQINIKNNGTHQFFADDEGHEGFFVCRMVKKYDS